MVTLSCKGDGEVDYLAFPPFYQRRTWKKEVGVRVGWPNSSAAPKGDGNEWGWGFAWEVRDGGRGGGLEAGTRPFY